MLVTIKEMAEKLRTYICFINELHLKTNFQKLLLIFCAVECQ